MKVHTMWGGKRQVRVDKFLLSHYTMVSSDPKYIYINISLGTIISNAKKNPTATN